MTSRQSLADALARLPPTWGEPELGRQSFVGDPPSIGSRACTVHIWHTRAALENILIARSDSLNMLTFVDAYGGTAIPAAVHLLISSDTIRCSPMTSLLVHVHSMSMFRQLLHTPEDSSHFTFRTRQVKHPCRQLVPNGALTGPDPLSLCRMFAFRCAHGVQDHERGQDHELFGERKVTGEEKVLRREGGGASASTRMRSRAVMQPRVAYDVLLSLWHTPTLHKVGLNA